MKRRLETIAVKGTLRFGRDLLLDRKSEERLLVWWKEDALGSSSVIGFRDQFGAFDSGF